MKNSLIVLALIASPAVASAGLPGFVPGGGPQLPVSNTTFECTGNLASSGAGLGVYVVRLSADLVETSNNSVAITQDFVASVAGDVNVTIETILPAIGPLPQGVRGPGPTLLPIVNFDRTYQVEGTQNAGMPSFQGQGYKLSETDSNVLVPGLNLAVSESNDGAKTASILFDGQSEATVLSCEAINFSL